jgi:hypothetical protein
MNQETVLQALMDARKILARALMDTIGAWPAHDKVSRAIAYIDKQTTPILQEMLAE